MLYSTSFLLAEIGTPCRVPGGLIGLSAIC